jgi:hypothetical protein
MATVIEDPELGNYYLGLIPYVENMGVSQDIETIGFSLECDKTYNYKQRVGVFYGYPGSIGSDGKLISGINHANGIICIKNDENIQNYDYFEVIDGTIKKILIQESVLDEKCEIGENTHNSSSKNSYEHKILPQCTNVECCINSNSELTVHQLDYNLNFSDKICGKFFGTPGEYYYDNIIKRYNRKYGNEYSVGTITMNGRFNFQYCYDKGKISSCIFNSKNSLKWIQLMKSIDL